MHEGSVNQSRMLVNREKSCWILSLKRINLEVQLYRCTCVALITNGDLEDFNQLEYIIPSHFIHNNGPKMCCIIFHNNGHGRREGGAREHGREEKGNDLISPWEHANER